jgi:hypothetical protein
MKHFKDYALIILIAFVAVFCYRSFNGIKDIQVVESVVHDTITQTKVTSRWLQGKDIPYVIIATDTVHDSVQYLVHDTIRIVSDYMRTYAYSDTINVDSNTFVINDTISQNKIQSRGFEAKITEKTILTTITKAAKAKNSLYLGFRGDLSESNGLEVLSPGIMLNAKNKALIGLSLNINKNFNIGYSGSVYFKLGKK